MLEVIKVYNITRTFKMLGFERKTTTKMVLIPNKRNWHFVLTNVQLVFNHP